MTVATWSTTDALNVVSGGVSGSGGANIDEGCPPSGINNAIRHIMAQIATLITDANFTLTSTDAGAAANPTLILHRNSASPAASDIIGRVTFRGEDSASNATDYGAIQAVIIDPTDASEDATLQFINFVAGTSRATWQIAAGVGTLTNFDAGAAAGPILQLHRDSASPAASDILGTIQFVGEDSGSGSPIYADIFATLVDPTDTSEDGKLTVRVMVAGAQTDKLTLDSTGATIGGDILAVSTDAGAAAAPTLTLQRDSASPAANDIIGRVLFQGEDSASNVEDYAEIITIITDTTSTSEDASVRIRNKVAGTMVNSFTIGAGAATLVSTDAGASSQPNILLDRDSASPAASDNLGSVQFVGRDDGSNSTVYGQIYGKIDDPADASEDGRVAIQVITAGAAGDVANFSGTTLRLYQDTTDTPGSGNNTVGVAVRSIGQVLISSSGTPLVVNKTADGNLVSLQSGGTSQGIISVSGATVAYGTFFGAHWSQLADGSKLEILRGTIVESLDQMAAWPGEVNEHLPCFKISDHAGTKRAYGVFAWWDDKDGGETNDAFVGALGAYLIRIDAGVTLTGGELIESAGNGCGRVQADDVMRASTVAKVSSTQVVDRYPDGSFTVPATLHCG